MRGRKTRLWYALVVLILIVVAAVDLLSRKRVTSELEAVPFDLSILRVSIQGFVEKHGSWPKSIDEIVGAGELQEHRGRRLQKYCVLLGDASDWPANAVIAYQHEPKGCPQYAALLNDGSVVPILIDPRSVASSPNHVTVREVNDAGVSIFKQVPMTGLTRGQKPQ